MSNPDEKDKNRQGSTGRPGTKFLEKPASESEAQKEEAQEAAQFGDQGVLDQQEKPEGTTDQEKKGDRWKAADPNPQDPAKKKMGQDKGEQKPEGDDQAGEEGMGKEE